MGDKIKKGVFIGLLAALFLPAVQQYFPTPFGGKLDGFYAAAPDTAFAFDHWWQGSYQLAKSNYANDNIGFRPAMVRVKNQVDYSLFDKLHGDWLAPGLDHYLFQTIHINGYYGRDYVGYEAIKERLRKLKAVQDTLEALGKTVVVIHAPCKAYYYPEFIDKPFRSAARTTTNLQAFLRIGDSLGVHQLDFNSWFVAMKYATKDPLYSRQGIHWSVYGSLVAADSFVTYLEQRRHTPLPHATWNEVVHTTIARETDDDLARTLNLVFPYTTDTFAYPKVHYTANAGHKPNVIYIGDSFLLNWIGDGLMQHTNSSWQVWEHFSTIWNSSYTEGQPHRTLKDDEWIDAINKSDCIVLMYTSFNLNEFGDGFIEKAYKHFFNC